MGRTAFFWKLWFGAARGNGFYTPRDEHEVAICWSLFWVSYNFSLARQFDLHAKEALFITRYP
jgi:hypothetical protein